MSKTKYIATTAIGIALYVAISMTAKIPLIGHISLDLGYIVLAVYCYHFGAVSGIVVGALGCMLVSLITTGMFPIGWMVGNAIIGYGCGIEFKQRKEPKVENPINGIFCLLICVLGILVVKTTIECSLYGIPLAIKIPKNAVAAFVDAVVMCIGVMVAPKIKFKK